MSLPSGTDGQLLARRGRTLWKLGHRKGARPHRYFWYRIGAFVAIHLFIAAVPLSGMFRFDFWRGHHLLWGEQVEFLEALRRFVIPFALVNVGIVVLVRWSGRFLCGWVCPVNFMNRWGDWLRGKVGGGKKWQLGLRGHAIAIGTSVLFAGLFSLWFVDWRVMVEGSPKARLGAGGLWLLLAAVSYVQMVGLTWRTCKKYCPSGVYFSVLGPKTMTGIERKKDGTDCEDCGLCVVNCPMELDPRDLLGRPREPQGFYFETMDNASLCIRCGDCVEACERFFEPRKLPPTLRMGFLQGNGDAMPQATETAEAAHEERAPGQQGEGTAEEEAA